MLTIRYQVGTICLLRGALFLLLSFKVYIPSFTRVLKCLRKGRCFRHFRLLGNISRSKKLSMFCKCLAIICSKLVLLMILFSSRAELSWRPYPSNYMAQPIRHIKIMQRLGYYHLLMEHTIPESQWVQ